MSLDTSKTVVKLTFNGQELSMESLVTPSSNGSKLGQVVDRSIQSLSAEDLGSIESIGTAAFQNCQSLTSVEIPSTVTTIGGSAFYYCKGLTNITIPSSVTSIGTSAFYLSNITEITILATTPPTLAAASAMPSGLVTIYIPAGTLSTYKSATNWSQFSSKFVELEA